MVFLLIGTQQSHQNFLRTGGLTIAAIGIVLGARAVSLYPCCLLFRWSPLRVSAKHQLALFWGGLRGAMALALALSLPREMPFHDQIVTASFAVVAFSVFVQGLTITPLLRIIGEIPGKNTSHQKEAEQVQGPA